MTRVIYDRRHRIKARRAKARWGNRCSVCLRHAGRHWWQVRLEAHHLLRLRRWSPYLPLCDRHHDAVHRWSDRIAGDRLLWAVSVGYWVLHWLVVLSVFAGAGWIYRQGWTLV